MDYLFAGKYDLSAPGVGHGLLYYSGLNSAKHGGQLKRICAPVISLIRFLVQFDSDINDEENIFFERFVQLPAEVLIMANFSKHILNDGDSLNNKTSKSSSGQSRHGSAEDALELLSIIMTDHRAVDEEGSTHADPLSLDIFLRDSKECKDRFSAWLQRSENEKIKNSAEKLRSKGKNNNAKESVDARPTAWEDVALTYIAVQEGEDGIVAVRDDYIVVAPLLQVQ